LIPKFFSEKARARLEKARVAAERRFYEAKGSLEPIVETSVWIEKVRDLCAQYALDICVAEAKEIARSELPLDEKLAALDRRVPEVSRKVMKLESHIWPLANIHLEKTLKQHLRNIELGQIIEFIKTSPEWKQCQDCILEGVAAPPAETPAAPAASPAAVPPAPLAPREVSRQKRGRPKVIPTDKGEGAELEERRAGTTPSDGKPYSQEDFAAVLGLGLTTYLNVVHGQGASINKLRRIVREYKKSFPNDPPLLLEKLTIWKKPE
jgi:hypothetical protein